MKGVEMSEKEEIKNPVLEEMDAILNEKEFKITKDKFRKFRQEVFAKTNYVNVLIDQSQSKTPELNRLASNNAKLIEAIAEVEKREVEHYKLINKAGAEMNDMRDKLEELCKSTDFIEAGAVLKILNDYTRFEVDEYALVDEHEVEIMHEIEYES